MFYICVIYVLINLIYCFIMFYRSKPIMHTFKHVSLVLNNPLKGLMHQREMSVLYADLVLTYILTSNARTS